ncbi:MAG: ABC transporter ATP-binding protein, partial [Candidatus Thorarchaeota archaeon]
MTQTAYETISEVPSQQGSESDIILEVTNLRKYFPIRGGVLQRTIGYVQAVDDVSFKIRRGETIGIVGESGCGKTTLGRVILGLIEPTRGSIVFQGKEVTNINSNSQEKMWRIKKRIIGYALSIIGLIAGAWGVLIFSSSFNKGLLMVNGPPMILAFVISLVLLAMGVKRLSQLSPLESWMRQKMQIVFQDPYASLNARASARRTLSEPITVHKVMKKKKIEPYLTSLLEEVGLSKVHLDRFPHEFSGGQRQRITIARALVLNPDLIILDEPTASADVSVRAKVLNLLADLQRERNLTYLFISHDLSIIEFISDKIMVMYLGHIVEFGPKRLFRQATNSHPYTRALIAAIPVPDPDHKGERII